MMLSINPIGDEFLVNDPVHGFQSLPAGAASVAVSEAAGTVTAYAGLGAGRRESIFLRSLDSAGAAPGAAVRASTTIQGSRTGAVIASNESGSTVVVWQGRGAGDKYGIFLQRFDAAGATVGDEHIVNQTRGGSQHDPAVGMAADGSFVVTWSGPNSGDAAGVFARRFGADGTALADEQLVNTTTANQQGEAAVAVSSGGDYVITWSSRHQDGSDWGVFGQRFSAGGVRQRGEFSVNTTTAASQRESSVALLGDGTLMVVWSSLGQDGDSWAVVGRRFDTTGLAAGDEFVINSSTAGHQRHPQVVGAAGQYLVTWQSGQADGSGWEIMVQQFDAQGVRVGSQQSVNSLQAGANSGHQQHPAAGLSAAGNAAVVWSGIGGSDRQGVFARSYEDDEATEPSLAPDLAAFAEQLAASNTRLFGAAWNADSTAQKELFEDGGQFLPFTEVTNSDQTPNQEAADFNITIFPTWIFPDGTRLEGVQSLQTLSARSGVAIPNSDQPLLAPIADDTLLVGSPLHVPLDGYDPNGGRLTYTVSTSSAAVVAEVLAGNRSARVDVAGYGDMVFELFERRAMRPTDRFIDLANDDFYNGILFHRVVNDFVIQGGDPLGTGTGGSSLGDFDDQFHVELQHNRTGLLSYAKSTDDTNDSQFFITEGASSSLRGLDFNHSIFGILVEGEANRAAISDTAVTGSSQSPRPLFDVVMQDVEIFQDDENAVLLLKADPGATGTVAVTVTATDQTGNTFERTFDVTLQDDTFNGRPFLGDIPSLGTLPRDTIAQIQLSATDVENDSFVIGAEEPLGNPVPYTFAVDANGLLEVTPPAGFVGTLEIIAKVGRTASSTSSDDDRQRILIEFV